MKLIYRFSLLCLLFLSVQVSGYSQDQPLRVMTFNIRYDNPADGINRWKYRREFVASFVENADVAGLQEVLRHQLDDLSRSLPKFRYAGAGRDDGKTKGEYSPVFYRHERFKLVDQGTFWLSQNPADTGSIGWDAALPRICTWVRLKEWSSDFEFFFLNTHFDHMGPIARAESARLIKAFIGRETAGLPVILTGDLNAGPDEEPYQILTADKGFFIDASAASEMTEDRNAGTFNGFGSADKSPRIDYILFHGNWHLFGYQVPNPVRGNLYISDHWPVVVKAITGSPKTTPVLPPAGLREDTTIVQTFTFDSINTRRAIFRFPDKSKRYRKILMYYTLKCDSLTPHDKYPCGEWDYTTYTRVFHPTGKTDTLKNTQASFIVGGQSPKSYLYSSLPTYRYYHADRGKPAAARPGNEEGKKFGGAIDRYALFEGSDYIETPGEAFKKVGEGITVAFWLYGDPFHQPMASTIFEGLDRDGKRVVNLHVPYDNGVVYWDAGGHGEGLTDNINKAASPMDYKGRWTHWTVTKNVTTGEQKIYLNGSLFQKGTGLKRTLDGISIFRIGSNGKGDGKFYHGGIDDFAVWDRELDSLEIQSLNTSFIRNYPADGLLFAYDFNDTADFPVILDISGNGNGGRCFGKPGMMEYLGFGGFPDSPDGPGSKLADSIPNPMVDIILFGDSLQPWKPTDTLSVFPGYHYHYNSQGILIDSTAAEGAETLQRKTRSWYGEPFEVVEQFEIGRFITPYGKRLDLGLQGFTWIYDVTEYEPLLHGNVDLQAANGQELLDLKFLFIEGTPPREVISVRNLWPEGSYLYKDLADDKALPAVNWQLATSAASFMLRARISGHGHFGPFNCCEWDPKVHRFILNQERSFQWKIWRDCGMNPVYPQGGTWQFDRAGWCPGTFVDTYDFEISPYVKPGTPVTIDYSIQPYDPDNGEEGGNYEMAMHLFEFSKPNYKLDLEITDILAPSTRQEFRRMNPVSINPVIRVKNNGIDTVSRFIVTYGLSGNQKERYQWTGKLAFMQSADIILPKPSWEGMTGLSTFTISIESVNGSSDEVQQNNHMSSEIEVPVILPATFIIHVKTQGFGRAADNAFRITDSDGNIVYERQVYEDDSIYQDLVRLPDGAYDFTFTDRNEDGMIRHWWLYWEDPDKVGENGELKILSSDKEEMINLGYDFAEKRTLQFFVGEPR